MGNNGIVLFYYSYKNQQTQREWYAFRKQCFDSRNRKQFMEKFNLYLYKFLKALKKKKKENYNLQA